MLLDLLTTMILKKLNISSRKRRLYQKIVKMSMTQTDCLQSLMGWNRLVRPAVQAPLDGVMQTVLRDPHVPIACLQYRLCYPIQLLQFSCLHAPASVSDVAYPIPVELPVTIATLSVWSEGKLIVHMLSLHTIM